ncbi:hypothetical protein EC973_006343 [Apophysomyces ossiformis]|uniref:Uncharacterized protein n=1 Tax=Apophysomyces ossiformis TaxID=679940 RepID=A0A8H7BZF1_9FUNG|nr:hypothetical protein EC973_006343 [Apophysomyces ossiformis]
MHPSRQHSTVFNTSSENLIPECQLVASINDLKTDVESEVTFMEKLACEMRHSYYAREINGLSNTKTDKCVQFIEHLEYIFGKAKDYYDGASQLNLICTLSEVLLGEDVIGTLPSLSLEETDGDPKLEDYIMDMFGWQIIELLKPFLTTDHGDENTSREMRRVSSELIQRISDRTSWKESIVMAAEQISFLTLSTHYPNEEECVRKAIEYVEFHRLAGQALERAPAKKVPQNFFYPASRCEYDLDLIKNIISEKSSWGCSNRSPNRWDDIVYCMVNTILDFIEFGGNTEISSDDLWEGKLDWETASDDIRQYYLCVFLLTMVFEKVILNLDMDLSKAYKKRYHKSYQVKRAANRMVHLYDGTSTPMLQTVYRCTGTSFDTGRLPNEDGGLSNVTDQQYPLSDLGIISILAMSIYHRCLFRESAKAPGLNLLAVILNGEWIGRNALGTIMKLLTEPQKTTHADKGLLILLLLADIVKVDITLETFENTFREDLSSTQEFPFLRAFQIASSFATMCPDSDLRLITYQLIAQFLRFCNEEACLFSLAELIEGCPFPTMRAAAVGLLKDRIDEAFKNQKDDNNEVPSVFTSRVIVDKFFPILFRMEHGWKTSDNDFLEGFGVQIQTLNFYLYLLIRDKGKNQTTLWDKERIEWVMKEYICPLEDRVDQLLPVFEEQRLSPTMISEEPLDSKILKLELLKNVTCQIEAQTNLP